MKRSLQLLAVLLLAPILCACAVELPTESTLPAAPTAAPTIAPTAAPTDPTEGAGSAEGLHYQSDDGAGCTVTSVGTCTDQTIVIPDTHDGKTVTAIGEYAFRSCYALTSVSIPDSVTSIGDWAFFNCMSLTSIRIPNSVTHIGSAAFSTCCALTSIDIPSGVTAIEDYAFSNCRALTSVTIPNSVTRIGNDAFSWCNALTSVDIPGGVTHIGNYAFYGCAKLTQVHFGGTYEQWNAVSKGDEWINGSLSYTVHCTDGDFSA